MTTLKTPDSKPTLAWLSTLLVAASMAACGGSDSAAPAAVAAAPAPTPAPAPAPAGNWVKVADEGQTFTVSGSQMARYGAGSQWVEKFVSSSTPCNAASFGWDPASGIFKQCQVWNGAPPAPLPNPIASSGCGVASPTGRVTGLQVLDGNSTTRNFELITSPGYDKSTPVPVVVLFHGAGGSMLDAENYGFQDAIKNAGDNGIVVAAQGIPWRNGSIGWEESCSGYDMPFFDEMVKYVSNHYCVDKSRIFVSGFSWGADMTNALAVCKGAQIRAIAPFSGSESAGTGATASTKIPAVRFRYGGADPYYSPQSFQNALSFYKNAQSCKPDWSPVEGSSCKAYNGCKAPVLDCGDPLLNHSGPSPKEVYETWKFFKSTP